MFVVMQWTKRT